MKWVVRTYRKVPRRTNLARRAFYENSILTGRDSKRQRKKFTQQLELLNALVALRNNDLDAVVNEPAEYVMPEEELPPEGTDYFEWKLDKVLYYPGEEKKTRNLLDEFPDYTYYKDKLGASWNFEMCPVLDEETLTYCVELTKQNMQSLYLTAGWTWNPEKKRNQMRKGDSRVFVVKDADTNERAGFAWVRFMREDDALVCYIYELQVGRKFQGRGIGKQLFNLLEKVARYWEMEWLMLTCFNCNTLAMNFYKDCGCERDETSPEDGEKNHQILSKKLFREGRRQ
mmetsp:Transcript_17662/g.29994  ORF Transcript_17662/g.29994 Transcript_17662/m.29994 type:complete len:285 (-) Transcript_17662:1692-2546(-)